MGAAPNDTNDAADSDEELPIYRAQRQPGETPRFIGRALEHMRSASVDGDLTFEHVDFEVAAGVWRESSITCSSCARCGAE